ncbi:hypothetical protein HGO53_03215 [Wolbachia endosymbiont of Diaphorina citri]|jgi:hypothetical protein|uniref:hypothetical protein n=1 Tax=Wolbachia endosymbiont of Diaphorina citri TaxID=116598 RepID=UPI0002F90B4E|nr:hypothetical protein [Wolbachia endosymbiont of Diaphorina citri]QJT94318.1 hypothetical protein HGO48_02505 [Wolbachia endosymbiont of Diaphorina citri]QJT95559.1 hypothetical protein HGO49_02505 [Wolbachia endosymbiont of Diaphorina citri]QJT96920.1 hypothetical protein HGO53_03215 [Wolbachia endosymbiont of Diaphorina citri]QLK11216.1 hypothetical protein FK497_02550 [Wolbachia endosymbiont of Diaphorina citri]QXY87251.1 hypothetical protein GZ064_05185 [Wolbachia endosymbiont of Diaphor
MSKNSQNLLQNADNVKQLIRDLDFITIKGVSGSDITNLNQMVTGNTLKTTVDQLVNNINEQLISSLNTKLGEEQAKVVSLQEIIGNESKGLQKDLIDLAAKLNNMLPEEAPPYYDML